MVVGCFASLVSLPRYPAVGDIGGIDGYFADGIPEALFREFGQDDELRIGECEHSADCRHKHLFVHGLQVHSLLRADEAA